MDDALDGGEPYPGTLEFVRAVQPLEGAEELVHVGHLEARPVVAHVVDRDATPYRELLVNAKLYTGLGFLRGELPGVADQVLQSHPEEPPIPPDLEHLLRRALHRPLRPRFPQALGHLLGQSAQVHALAVHAASSHARETQKVVYEAAHPLAGGPHPAQVVLAVFIELARVVFEEYLREAVYAPQRRPQVVGDGVGERLELAIGRLELAVGVFQVPPGLLGSHAAADKHEGYAEEQEARRETANEHEERQPALPGLLEPRQRLEVQAPLSSRQVEPAEAGELGSLPDHRPADRLHERPG